MSNTWALIVALTVAPLWSQAGVTNTDELKFDADVLERARRLGEAVQQAKKWTESAELRTGRLAGLTNTDWAIEMQLTSLQRALSGVAAADFEGRSRWMVQIEKTYNEGLRVHAQVDQLWQKLLETGQHMNVVFNAASPECTATGIKEDRTSVRAVEAWQNACREFTSERSRFEPIYKRTKEQGAELKAHQQSSEARWRAALDDARYVDRR